MVICVKSADLLENVNDSSVVLEFLKEAMGRADASLLFESTTPLPEELEGVSGVKRVHNLLDLATFLRKVSLV